MKFWKALAKKNKKSVEKISNDSRNLQGSHNVFIYTEGNPIRCMACGSTFFSYKDIEEHYNVCATEKIVIKQGFSFVS